MEIVNNYPTEPLLEAYFSVGIHPWYIPENWREELAICTEKLANPKALALGECGLDNRIETSKALQWEVCEAQFRLAEAMQKPIIVHCVGYFQEIIQLKRRLKLTVPIVIHGFSKNITVAQQLLAHGFYISFGKYLMLNPKLSEVWVQMPLNRVFLETDNSAYGITELYAQGSRLLNISEKVMAEQIESNFERVFKK